MSLEAIIAQNAAAVAAATGQPPPATPAAAAVQAIPAGTANPAVVTPPAPAAFTLTPEQWAAYSSTQTRLAELEQAERKRVSEAQAAEVKALEAEGKIRQAFDLQREQARLEIESERKRFKDTEERAKRYALDGELARALGAQNLVTGGAEQLTQLWRNQFTVEAQGDSFAVRTPDYQPVGAYIAAQLGRPEYAHFLRAQNPGGGTAGGTGTGTMPTAAANPAAAVEPKNMSEAIRMNWAARQLAVGNPAESGGGVYGADGKVIPQPAGGFGLRPLSRQA